MTQPAIRTYRAEDESEIVELTKVAWVEATVWQTIEARYGRRGDKPWWQHKLRPILDCARTRPECFLVAECEGKIAGYATYSLDAESKIGTVGNTEYRGAVAGSVPGAADVHVDPGIPD